MTGLSRAGFYCCRVPRQAKVVEMEIRDQMQKVALESSAYGYRRVTTEPRRVVTTNSPHNLPIYPGKFSCSAM
jgi:hypothetical protein